MEPRAGRHSGLAAPDPRWQAAFYFVVFQWPRDLNYTLIMLAKRTTTRLLTLALIGSAALLGACRSKQMVITSDPPGATVTLNDVEIGRTPTTASFTHYGVYDVLLTLDEHEPLRTEARASAPVYDWPPFDLITSPIPGETTIRWHFTMQPSLESTLTPEQLEAGLLGRARDLRGQIDAPK